MSRGGDGDRGGGSGGKGGGVEVGEMKADIEDGWGVGEMRADIGEVGMVEVRGG